MDNTSLQKLAVAGDDTYLFRDETPSKKSNVFTHKSAWKILIVDDDRDIHTVTRLVLANGSFENKPFELFSAYSGAQAEELIREHPDAALILLDVVMEEDDSGLKFVKYLREKLENKMIRIILRTGQPGVAPILKAVVEYDINDYKEKTEMTKENFYSSVILALRTFRTLKDLENKCTEIKKQSVATEKFIPRIFLEVLNKKNIMDVNPFDHIQKEITILFLDVRSFTSISELITPLEVFEFVNTWIKYMEPIITRRNGFIDKYMGDGILAFFMGNPEDAVHTSIELLQALQAYNQERVLSQKIPIRIGIGINTGPVVIGVVGFRNRIECTVIGDAVNSTERIEKCNKLFGTSIIVSENTMLQINNRDKFHYRNLGKIQVSGKKIQMQVYEIFDADRIKSFAYKQKTKQMLEKAIEFYQDGDYHSASKLLEPIYEENPQDSVARYFLDECNQAMSQKK